MPFLIGVGAFFKKISFEVWVVIAIVGAALLGIYIVDRNAVLRTKKKQEVDNLRNTIELQEKSVEIINEIETRVEQADEAVSRLPYLRSTDELRAHDSELASLILDDNEGHER